MSKVAAIQMASGPNVKANLAEAEKLIKIAVRKRRSLLCFLKILPSWELLKLIN